MATARQRKAVQRLVETGGKSVSAAMRDAGYPPATAKNPSKLTKSKSWQELIDQYLPEKKIAQVHKKLLDAKYVDHMVFPLATPEAEITELLKSVGCTTRRFQHSEQAIHCWFWAPNTKAQKDAIELAYKLRGRLKEKVELDVRDVSKVLDELDDPREDMARGAEQHLTELGAGGRPETTEQMVETDTPLQDQG